MECALLLCPCDAERSATDVGAVSGLRIFVKVIFTMKGSPAK